MENFIFSQKLCYKMAEAAQKVQEELGVSICMSISDKHGNLRYFYRFGEAIVPSIDISQKKAYTAAVLGQSTRAFGKIAQVNGEAFGINITHPKLVIFGGGFPLKVKGETVGGLGISGGSVAEDEAVAQKTLEAFYQETGQTHG